jgi:two-component system, OmpR family, sensor histidine kinase VicK
VKKTEILHGQDNIKKRTINDFHLIQNRLDNCTDSTGPYVIDTPLWSEFLELKQKGIKLRLITEITKDNIGYSKEIVKVFETRHLDEIKGNFGIADGREYGGGASITKGEPPIEFIRSNVQAFVDQQQFFFETLWNKAIPAEQRIREIDEGIEPIKTKILENQEEIYDYFIKSIEKSTQLYICSSIGALQIVYNNFFNLYKEIIERQKRYGEYGVKWLTFIDDSKNSIERVKSFLNEGIRIRHIKNLPSMNFWVNNNDIHATIGGMDKDRSIDKLLVSNEPAYVNHFVSYFLDLWNNQGIDALERIKDIEEDMEYDIEVIRHSDRTLKIYLDIVKSSQSEIFFILPTPKAFVRQFNILYLACQISKERKVKVRILTPKDKVIEDFIKQLLKEANGNSNSFVFNSDGDIRVRYIEKMSYTKSSIVVVDRKESLVMELKDDTKDTFTDAIGLSTHSTSKASVLSYVAIFENLWKQSELYQEIMESNEKLEVKDKVLNEFIHIASHEIRNPIQPILSLSQIVKLELSKKIESGTDNDKILNLLDVIIRNAKKLHRLTEDVLDIAKIETNSLALSREIFNLKDLIQDVIDDCKSQQKNDTCNIELHFNTERQKQQPELENNFFLIEADKARISQVISNLLINALKFTNNDCLIQVTIERNVVENMRKEFIVTIKDTGKGIDSEMIPKLFTKFASKSDKGTGLGLYICKNIVDAHNGKIWAFNNRHGKGATFSFSLPIDN